MQLITHFRQAPQLIYFHLKYTYLELRVYFKSQYRLDYPTTNSITNYFFFSFYVWLKFDLWHEFDHSLQINMVKIQFQDQPQSFCLAI